MLAKYKISPVKESFAINIHILTFNKYTVDYEGGKQDHSTLSEKQFENDLNLHKRTDYSIIMCN